ncbi:MAG: zinc ABC transporter substrate-binding protein [Candidatus Buchananbacteria bacterium]|nr:zinc ABC transporter substrate-binding protein [Candidatus Buchananbacteria bacterium]
MKKSLLATIVIVILLGLAVIVGLALVQNKPAKQSTDQLTVAATIFPIADIVKNIGQPYINVVTVLPPGASPHTFELRPSDIKSLQNARAVFAVGHGLDEWISPLFNSLPDLKLITVDNNIKLQTFGSENIPSLEDESENHEGDHEDHHDHSDSDLDPHYWLSTDNAKIIAQTVVDQLTIIDPIHAQNFKDNLKNYQQALDDLKSQSLAILQSGQINDLVVFHESWAYFADEFGLKIAGIFEPQPGQEPSPKYLQSLYQTTQASGVEVIFTEPQLSSEVIKSFVNDLGLKMMILDPIGGLDSRQSYVDLIKYNVETIHDAFNQ